MFDLSLLASLPDYEGRGGNPYVYAHYHVPDDAFSFYVLGATRAAQGYLVGGFLLASEREHDWGFVLLRPETLERLAGGRLVRDDSFAPGYLTDVVPLPWD
ncbi:MAG: hypothetical protein SFV54_25070 [Bryobacteraceae bacterium]|nr:hypothetical protein [Bryobacteraceae bacterium]